MRTALNSKSLLFFGLSLISITTANQKDLDRDFKQIVFARNYSVEEHQIMTKDGYILTLFRIPGKLGDIQTPPGPPVLLQHGLIDSSDAWVVNDEDSPAFILSDAGYDVWLGNNRGNKYSRRHISLQPESEDFWNFSWEELGTYDLPAFTDYILSVSRY